VESDYVVRTMKLHK